MCEKHHFSPEGEDGRCWDNNVMFFLLFYSYLRVQQATSQPRCFPRLIYGGSDSGPGVMEWACVRNITWDVCYKFVGVPEKTGWQPLFEMESARPKKV